MIKLQSKKLFIIAAYANNQANKKFINELDYLFNKLNLIDVNNLYVVAGDFNARHTLWGDSIDRRKGIMLKNWLDNEGIVYRSRIIPPSTATFPRANSFLDLCLLDSRLKIINLNNDKIRTLDYNSDHCALSFTINLSDIAIINNIDPNNSYRFIFKKTKWNKFSKKLRKLHNEEIPHNRNLSIHEINNYISNIELSIKKTIDETVPKYNPNNNVLNYISDKIKKLHRYKSFLVTTLNNHYKQAYPPTSHSIPFLKSIINKINVVLKNEYKTTYTKYWETQIATIDHRNSDQFFLKINRYFRPKEQLKIDCLSIDINDDIIEKSGCNITELRLDQNKYVIETPTEILNTIGAFYEKINSPTYFNANTDLKVKVDNKVNELINNFKLNTSPITIFSDSNTSTHPKTIKNSIAFFNTAEVLYLFKNLPNKGSSGLDNIPPIILKHLPIEIIKQYTIIFNNCLNHRYYPDCWKRAKILPILKKSKPADDPASYRPISLTPAISKIYEMIINYSITTHTQNNSIIPDNQFGFQHQLSTTHAIHKLVSDIYYHLNKGEFVGACLIDLQRAFDSVWINGLLYIMNELKYPLDLIHTIWNMTTGRSFVTWNGDLLSTKIFNIIEGLMQGTVNSPSLFNIFTYKIPTLFNANRNNNIYSIAFADDFILLVADNQPSVIRDKLETMVNKISKQYIEWNLKINPSKCETIFFHKPLNTIGSNKRDAIKNFQISINIDNDIYPIQHKKVVRYLGVMLDNLLRLNIHIKTQLAKAKNVFKKYSRLFFNKTLSPRSKIICYLLLIRPIITYAAPIWWNVSASTMEKLRKFERYCLRAALHIYRKDQNKHFISNQIIYNKANIPRIDNHIIKLSRDYYANLRNIKNSYLYSYSHTAEYEILPNTQTEYIYPHSFTFFDTNNIIQNDQNTPILYHIARHQANKKINYSLPNPTLKYSMTIPNRDHCDAYKFLKKYWWIPVDKNKADEIRKRDKRKH